jgi:diaminopimelate epimerase
MMKIEFTKMQGLGNDFVVLDFTDKPCELNKEQLQWIADRHFGVGGDQILIVEQATGPGVDFRYRIFNADGGEVEQCGNGARCFVKFVHARRLTAKREIRVETLCGVIVPRLEDGGEVTVDMGVPEFAPARVPFASDSDALVQPLEVGGVTLQITAVSMGNPHAVQLVADVDAAPVLTQGPLIERHVRFPQRVNAGYMQVQDRGRIRLRVYERGTGETLACGSGACAAVAAGIRRGLLDARVRVCTRGGDLTISWEGGDNPVWLTGPAVTVFEGEIEIDEC